MASNEFNNIFKIPELRKRIFYTFALLAVYRIGSHIPTPGIDAAALADFFSRTRGTILGFFDMFSGGALSRLTIFALGIMPYISVSIILELMVVVVPALEKLKKEGEAGHRKINQYTRYGTVFLCVFQAMGISYWLESMRSPTGALVVSNPGWHFRFVTVLTLTAGTTFIMWLGEQITERGIGNGISLIIFAGIVAGMPSAIVNSYRLLASGEIRLLVLLAVLVLMLAVVAGIVFMESAQRRIPVQYAKRVVGRKMYSGQSTHLPLKVNTAGVIPPIFASSIIMFPSMVANFVDHPVMKRVSGFLMPGTAFYTTIYVAMIFFFCYFYTAIVFDPVEVADNMKKHGGFIPGIRPGRPTASHIDRILTRITLIGAVYVSVVCVLPDFFIKNFGIPFYFGGTGLLIVVGVAMDTISQVESHLVMRHYDAFNKKKNRG